MTTNADLANWGEPPASVEEEAQAQILAALLDRIRQGEPEAAVLLRGSAELSPVENELIGTLSWVSDLATSIDQHAGFSDQRVVPLPLTAAVPDPFPGEFRIIGFLGEGSFGQVWLALDLNMDRQVALKALKLRGSAAEGAAEALRLEARLLASVRHPNVVQVHALRPCGDDYYLVLQYVSGGSLAARLKKEGPLPWKKAARYVADAGEALLEVHARGIVHRDINPANILWDPEKDEALLTDFGVSCRLADRTMPAAGTIPYMAPEAIESRVTPALDVFSLAATLFRLVTGEVPFVAPSLGAHIESVLAGLPHEDPRCQALPPALQALIRAGLSASPRTRPGLQEFVQILRGTLNHLLADSILGAGMDPSAPAPVNLRLVVSRELAQTVFMPVPATRSAESVPGGVSGDMPPAPASIQVHTGERVRIQVSADRAGYVAVLNIGPKGNLHLLHPDASEASASSYLQANLKLDVLDVELTPPAGRERLIAFWSRMPLPLHELTSLARTRAEGVSQSYCATRDMERVGGVVRKLPREDWHAVVLELDHQDRT